MIRALYGAGGFSHDIISSLGNGLVILRFVDNKYFKENNENIYPLGAESILDFEYCEFIVAVANPQDKKDMVGRLPKNTKFWTHISPKVHSGPGVKVGIGSAILTNSILVCHNEIGDHCSINFNVVIGHDTKLGNFFTAAPGVFIGGDCNIGNRVYFGGNSCCKQKITICDDVTVGMGAVVVNDITEPGVYVGCPARKVK